MANQKVIEIINVRRSTEGIKFVQPIYESIWLKREEKLRNDGWIPTESIERIEIVPVDDGKGIRTVEVVGEKEDAKSLDDLNLVELKEMCDKRNIKYHHASKENKLIQLLTEAK